MSIIANGHITKKTYTLSLSIGIKLIALSNLIDILSSTLSSKIVRYPNVLYGKSFVVTCM